MDIGRDLRKLEEGIEIPIPLDEDGYLDRQCPHEECEHDFKILAEDWQDKVRDEEVFCPICGHTAESDDWVTDEQMRHVQEVAERMVVEALDGEMRRMCRDFNRKQRSGGLITMSMKYSAGAPPVVLPIEVADLMRQRYKCEKCECRYAAIGAAFFCPACGHNSARSTFETTMETIRKTVTGIEDVRRVLEEKLDRDTAANTVRQTLESSLVSIVASFQRFAEATFAAIPQSAGVTVARNAFQRLVESSELWRNAIGKGYEEMLTANEWERLQILFQQRHLLQHQEGFVDEHYIRKTGDLTYREGQRLVVKAGFVLSCCALVCKLAGEINAGIEEDRRQAGEGAA